MADVVNKQQTTALFLFTIVNTEMAKIKTRWETCAVPGNTIFSFRVFYVYHIFSWQTATAADVAWFAGRTSKNTSDIPKVLIYCVIFIVYT
jgi:hypothetical protein